MDQPSTSTGTAKRRLSLETPNDPKRHNGGKNDHGERVRLRANYFRLLKPPNFEIYKCQVEFEPACEMVRLRIELLKQHKDTFGGYLFDGEQLFSTRIPRTDEGVLQLQSKTRTGKTYMLTFKSITFVWFERESQILNLILRRATNDLNWNLVGRNYYDTESKIDLNQFKTELWPGYATAVRKHIRDTVLMCNAVHKVMRNDTVYDLMRETYNSDRTNFQNNFKQKVIGLTVLTPHNNQKYRIDDVDFEKSPIYKFNRKGTGGGMLKDYYKKRYSIKIQYENQPLLISKLKEKNTRGGNEMRMSMVAVWLIPELCRITGMTERQRNDIGLENAMKPHLQMEPRVQIQRLLDYNQRFQDSASSIEVLRSWNLELDRKLVEIDGYRLKPERLLFGQNREHQVVNGDWNGDWNGECGQSLRLYQVCNPLQRWYIIFPDKIEREVKKFINRARKIGQNMGFEISNPRKIIVQNDRAMVGEVDQLVSSNPQMVCFIVTSDKKNNGDIYSSIQQKCYGDHAISSLVVTEFCLSKDKDSIVKKIVIQMCAKLGGVPWGIEIPLAGVMTIGFVVSQDSRDKNRLYGCVVATMDLKQDFSFFTKVATYNNPKKSTDSPEKPTDEFIMCVREALVAFREKYGFFPRKIIIYRSDVGNYRGSRVYYLEQSLNEMYKKAQQKLEMAFIVVTKKMKTRLFEGDHNPNSGTVVDSSINPSHYSAFFLISTSSTQGAVSPTKYNIISNTSGLTAEELQIWTYKHTHLYWNWSGTAKVPAVLQYATKLAFLVSNHMHCVPHIDLERSLYFL